MAWGVVWFLVSAAREGRSLRVRVPWPAAFLLFPFGGLLLSGVSLLSLPLAATVVVRVALGEIREWIVKENGS